MNQPFFRYTWMMISLLILSFAANGVVAQRLLALDKSGRKKRVHYFEGDKIKIQLQDGYVKAGRIDAIYDTSFVINGDKIMLKEVRFVYRRSTALTFFGGLFITGGLFYLGINSINTISNTDSPLDSRILIPTLSAVAVGGTFLIFAVKKHNVYQNGKFKILNVTPIPIKG